MRCEICGLPADRHHVVSRGAGGVDEEYNILLLCRGHHREIHSIGWRTFARRYPKVREAVEAARYRQGRKM